MVNQKYGRSKPAKICRRNSDRTICCGLLLCYLLLVDKSEKMQGRGTGKWLQLSQVDTFILRRKLCWYN